MKSVQFQFQSSISELSNENRKYSIFKEKQLYNNQTIDFYQSGDLVNHNNLLGFIV